MEDKIYELLLKIEKKLNGIELDIKDIRSELSEIHEEEFKIQEKLVCVVNKVRGVQSDLRDLK